MVLGLGAGKIEILLDKPTYKQGEMLTGKVRLEMSGTQKAKGLRLKLWAERGIASGRRRGRRKEIVHQFETSLDGEHEYSGSKEYGFEIALPQLGEQSPAGATLSIGGLTLSSGSYATPPRWYLQASLDMPLAMDVMKLVQLNVS